eukprot:2675239-Pleurochrysis_carterae.AAC.1
MAAIESVGGGRGTGKLFLACRAAESTLRTQLEPPHPFCLPLPSLLLFDLGSSRPKLSRRRRVTRYRLDSTNDDARANYIVLP